MGSLLLCAGAKGFRYSLPHSRIMLHQPMGGAGGQCSDIQIQANEIQDLKKKLNAIYAKHSGKDLSYIEKQTDRDNFLSPEMAKEFGLIDSIIEKMKK